jgi:hypothetical protein
MSIGVAAVRMRRIHRSRCWHWHMPGDSKKVEKLLSRAQRELKLLEKNLEKN